MLSQLADWASVLGAALGALGTLFSILAFRAAKKAKQSAEDARRAVRTLAAADKFHRLGSQAKELSQHIDHRNLPVALFLANELRFDINAALNRWEFLDVETKERFREVRPAH